MRNCISLQTVFDTSNINKEFPIGGVVTNVMLKTSKNGNPFAIVKIEDYNSSMEMMFFGNEYTKFRNYFEVGLFLYIRGKIQSKWGRDGDFEFKPVSIELLSEIRDKLFKEVKVKVDARLVNSNFIEDLQKVMLKDKNRGTFDFKMSVYDSDEKMDVMLLSRKQKVASTNDFVKELKELVGEENVVLA